MLPKFEASEIHTLTANKVGFLTSPMKLPKANYINYYDQNPPVESQGLNR